MELRKEAALGGALGTGPVTTQAGSLLWVEGPRGPPDQEGPLGAAPSIFGTASRVPPLWSKTTYAGILEHG